MAPEPSPGGTASSSSKDDEMQNPNLGEGSPIKEDLPKKYFIKPKLLLALRDVGASNKSYTGAEVLQFFKNYIFKNRLTSGKIVKCDQKLKSAFKIDFITYEDCLRILKSQLIDEQFVAESIGASCSNSSNTHQTNESSQNRSLVDIKFNLPVVPEPISDAKTVYSSQGIETASCRNSEDDDDTPDEEDVIEEEEDVEEGELELVTEEEDEGERDSDSDGAQSVILEIWDSCASSHTDEDNFADESDTMSGSDFESESVHSTEDEKDSWPCISCGIKNKPFMRYCLKCWQTRTDWYPDRPKKKKKRKVRPKKKRTSDAASKKLKESSSQSPPVPMEESYIQHPPNSEASFARPIEESLASSSSSLSLSRSDSMNTQSSVSTTATSSSSSSQESGFGSQETFFSEEEEEDAVSTDEPLPPPPLPRPQSRVSSKRKKSLSESESPRKLPRTSQLDNKLHSKFKKFSRTREGRRWLMNSSLPVKLQDFSSDSEGAESPPSDMCTVCCTRPVNASIVHGRLSHIAFCISCANKLWKSKQRCPLCRRKIHMVTRNAFA